MNNPESTSENQSPGDQSQEDLRRQPLELLAAEYSEKIRCGQLVSVDDYVRRCPELADEIKELFPTIAALEKMKAADNKDQARLATTLPLNLKELGDFEIIREIGRGGMGIVFEAVQRSLGRRVALKVLPKAALLDPKQLHRFSREAHIAAKLHHSHLVSLHGVGEHDGYHFLVMELIDGSSLDKILPLVRRKLQPASDPPPGCENPEVANQKIDLAAERIAEKLVGSLDHPATRSDRKNYFRLVAAIGSDAAGAIQYAYQQGVFHRDIKPANLILDHDTHIWVSDFGLARSLVSTEEEMLEDVRVTRTIDGTFAYMPPESFDGHLTQQSDLYSLGVTLYEMLTLKPVWENENLSSTIKRLSDDAHKLAPLRSVDPSIPRDLETIVMKATAKRPSERYSTAGLMAADLQRFLDGRPVKASRTSVFQHAVRWTDRNRLSTALVATALLMLGLLLAVLAISFYRVKISNNQVTSSLKRETRLREQSQHSLAVATKALDGIYHELVPDDLNISSYIASEMSEVGEGNASEEGTAVRSAEVSVETAAVLDNLIDFYQQLAKEADHQSPLAAATIASLGRIGDIYLHLGKLDQAAQRYRQALNEFDLHNDTSELPVSVSVETARILNQLGVVYRSQKHYVESHFAHLAAMEELAVVTDPDDFSAQFQMARTHYLLGQREKENAARVVIDQVVGRGYGPPPGKAGRPRKRGSGGDWQRRSHHLKIAIEVLSDLKKQSPQNASCNFLIGCCYRELGESGLAAETFSDLVAQYSENPHYRLELVETLRSSFQDGRSERSNGGDEIEDQLIALEHADWLVQRYPNAPQYGLSRMHVLHRLGHAFNNRSKANRGVERSQQIQKAVEYLKLADQQAKILSGQWPNISEHLLWSVVVKTSLTAALLGDDRNDEAADVVVDAVDQFNELLVHKQAGANYSDKDVRPIYDVLLDLARQCDSETAQTALKPLP